jgi:NTP pyrophosphatase (non-canonical NTP hydrolase)
MVIIVKISEAQDSVKEILKALKVESSPLASLLCVYEELGELSRALLQKEGFKERENQADIGYVLAEVFYELLKLAEDCDIDLEKEFKLALKQWKTSKLF